MERRNPFVTTVSISYGAEALSGTEVCTGGDERYPEHSGKHQPGIGSAVCHPALQLSVPNLMRTLLLYELFYQECPNYQHSCIKNSYKVLSSGQGSWTICRENHGSHG